MYWIRLDSSVCTNHRKYTCNLLRYHFFEWCANGVNFSSCDKVYICPFARVSQPIWLRFCFLFRCFFLSFFVITKNTHTNTMRSALPQTIHAMQMHLISFATTRNKNGNAITEFNNSVSFRLQLFYFSVQNFRCWLIQFQMLPSTTTKYGLGKVRVQWKHLQLATDERRLIGSCNVRATRVSTGM